MSEIVQPPQQEQFAFLNKADTDVITIKDSASDTGFTQAQVAVVDNIDMIVNERCVGFETTPGRARTGH